MRPSGRCPRCGYVLTYDGYRYYCTFCGYPRTHPKLTNALHSLERNVRAGIQRVHDEFRPKTQRYVTYYPVNVVLQQPCANCGISYPSQVQVCPSCGAPRSTTPQTAPPPPTTTEPRGLDGRVLDYIVAREGTISISQAAQDLSINQTLLLSTIERLKADGFLNQAS